MNPHQTYKELIEYMRSKDWEYNPEWVPEFYKISNHGKFEARSTWNIETEATPTCDIYDINIKKENEKLSGEYYVALGEWHRNSPSYLTKIFNPNKYKKIMNAKPKYIEQKNPFIASIQIDLSVDATEEFIEKLLLLNTDQTKE